VLARSTTGYGQLAAPSAGAARPPFEQANPGDQPMTQLIIHGFPQSTYVRTARMVCEEKGVAYELALLKLHSEEHLALHPFGKVPIMEHGDVRLRETSAIARYIDEVFQGPALVPATAVERAYMEEWISQINSYMYTDIIRNYVFHYIFPKEEGKPDKALIEAGVPHLKRDLELINESMGKREWLAGKTLSIADLLLCPILAYAAMFPEAQEIMGKCPNLQRGGKAIMSRPSFGKTAPPMPGK
jgi:glutathione S-transferase